MANLAQRLLTGLHTSVLRGTKGRVGGRVGKAPVLVLCTVGARSGKRRLSPLLYLADGDGYDVIASNGGAAEHPGWYHNLRASPDAEVQVADRTIPVRAEVLEGDERERAWQGLVAVYQSYDKYQIKTSRTIPVVRLRPR